MLAPPRRSARPTHDSCRQPAHKPGTDEWKAWEHDYVRRRSSNTDEWIAMAALGRKRLDALKARTVWTERQAEVAAVLAEVEEATRECGPGRVERKVMSGNPDVREIVVHRASVPAPGVITINTGVDPNYIAQAIREYMALDHPPGSDDARAVRDYRKALDELDRLLDDWTWT